MTLTCYSQNCNASRCFPHVTSIHAELNSGAGGSKAKSEKMCFDLTSWFQFGAATEEERRQASEASVSKAVVPTAKQIGNKPKML